jgi:tetratricopeptide (TPR) repeat protein
MKTTAPIPTLRMLSSFAVFCALASTTFAQEVGDDVVVMSDHVGLRAEKGADSALSKGEIVSVLKVEGGRFFVRLAQGRDAQAECWINRSDVQALSPAQAAASDEIKHEPSAQAYALRAKIWQALHEYEKALADFDEAIRRDPKQATFYCDRGTAHSYKRQDDQAIADYSEAIRLDPKFATAYVRRAYAWRAKAKYDTAMADCDEALRINPSFAAGRMAKAAVWNQSRQYGLAISECGEAIRLDPNFAMAFAGRGYAWQLKKEYAKALSDYNEAIRLAPKTAATYMNRGTVHDAMEQYDLSLQDYDAAARLSPKSFTPLVARAWVRATCPDPRYRDANKSLKDAKKACELAEWKDGNCLEVLAAAYAENGDFLNAVTWQKKAIDLVPPSNKRQRATLETRLHLFQSGRPYHEPRHD